MSERSSVVTFRYLSVCSGLEAATVAWRPLGWQAAAYSEIERFPRAVLQHHYPDVPLHGDFTTIKGDEYGPIDLLCGGTPCQAFSFAGNRKGLDDERGNLALEFCLLAERCGARWIVWENVPGVLSSNEGRDFAAFLGALSELGYGWSYRVLDLQFFGIPQRRRRVVLVGHLGDWRTAAAVLFEPESLQGHPAPRREKGQRVAGTLEARASTGGYDPGAHGAASGHLIPALTTKPYADNEAQHGKLVPEVAHTLRGEGFDASEDGTGRGTPIVPVGFGGGNCSGSIDVAACLTAKGQRQDFDIETFVADPAAFNCKQTSYIAEPQSVAIRGREEGARIELGGDQSHTIRASQGGSDKPHMFDGYAVRRLTPVECERLMGFPDNYTRIPYRGKPADQCPDGPRYKALGNSWGVPVFEWVGRRIDMMDKIFKEQAA